MKKTIRIISIAAAVLLGLAALLYLGGLLCQLLETTLPGSRPAV